MKNKWFVITLTLWPLSLYGGGFKMGLGKAVATVGSDVFEEAAERDLASATGDRVAQNLPTCGSDRPYTVSPVVESDIQGVDPLGHVNPPGHTFPSDHIYFYLVPVDTANPSGPRVVTNLLAPANLRITGISSSYINGNLATIDYGIEFYACRELKSYLTHVRSLSSAVLSTLNSSNQDCQDYSTGGSSFHRCYAATNIPINVGDVMGTVGGTAAAVDFGSYDFRRTPIAFLSPTRHYTYQAYTVCPIDYFESTVKTVLETHLGRWDGVVQRTQAPVCGDILYDVSATAMGDWYKIGSADSPEDPHAALIYDNVYATRQEFSIGTSVPGVSPTFLSFNQQSSGTHNRDFSQVSSDGEVYCYDTFFDPIGQAAAPGYSLLITMPSSTSLRIGKYTSSNCGSGPWTLSTYAEFQR